MKTVRTLLACSILLGASFANADALAVKVGGQYWLTDYDSEQFTTDSTAATAWVAFEHPIPIVPNVKIRATQLERDGSASADTIDSIDYLLYYEVLDNPFATLDLGLGMMSIDADNNINGYDGNYPEYYISGRLPLLDRDEGIGLYTEIYGIYDNTVSHYDATVGISYSFSFTVVDLHLQLGYRMAEYKSEQLFEINGLFEDDTTNFKGLTLGIEIDI